MLDPGEAGVRKMGTVSASLVLSFKLRVLGWREKERGREQERERRATGWKGVNERRVGGVQSENEAEGAEGRDKNKVSD